MTLKGDSLVFDWGNTLVLDPFDHIAPETSKKASKIAANSFDFKLDPKKFLKAWTRANDEINFQYASHFSQEEPWIQAGLRETGVPAAIRALLAPQILAHYRLAFRARLEHDPRKEEIKATLGELHQRGKHLAVLSNDRSFTPQSTLTWLGVADLFDHFLTSEEIGIEKPDPKVFTVVAKRFGKPIADIIFIGDLLSEVFSAHKAGAKAILYLPPKKYQTSKVWRDYSARLDKPDAVVKQFRDLLKVIK